MNKCPPKPEGSGAGGPERSRRGQSDVLALTILIGMIFVGAAAVIITGGYLVDGVQQDSKHQLAQDSADQTHQRIFEAASSGDARQLPDGEVVDSGSITLAMTNDRRECGSVDADLGAIEFDADGRQVIYEGGAVWERSEAGYSIRRAPGINYSDGRSQISLTVIEGASRNDDGELVVEPNESRSSQLNRDISDMILDCRLQNAGYRDLNVSVESNHADVWEQYFEESVAAGSANVSVSRPSAGRVNLTIDDLSDPIDYDEWLVIHEWERDDDNVRIENGEEGLNVSARVRNTGPIPTSGTIELNIEGTTYDSKPVDSLESNQLDWKSLQASSSQLETLTPGEVYNYSIDIRNGSEPWNEGPNSSVSHRFYFGQPQPEFIVTDVWAGPNGTEYDVGGDIDNIGVDNDTQPVTLSLTHVGSGTSVPVNGDTIDRTLEPDQRGSVIWQLNRSTLAGGEYEFTIATEDDSQTGTFTIDGLAGDGTEVSTGTAGTATMTVLGTEVSAETLRNVDVPEAGREDATLERVDRGMFTPTVRAYAERDWRGNFEGWEIPEQSSGWVPAERVDGTLEPMDTAPDCDDGPTYYYTPTNGDEWRGWVADECWDDPDGFVWSEDGGYDLQWAIAGNTRINSRHYNAPTVSREDTPWSFGDDADLEYDKRWAPVSVSAVVQDDGEKDRYHSWNPTNTDQGENLNTHTTQEREWTQEIELRRGDSITVASTLWECDDYDHQRTRYDELGYQWNDYDCSDIDDEYNPVDASENPNDPGIRVLGGDSVVPEVRAGYPDQRSVDEVLNTGAEHRINATTGELDLGPREFVFLLELTKLDPSWEQAKQRDSYGDPNYNDVIVLMEYESHITEVSVVSQGTPDNSPGWVDQGADDGASDTETGGEGSNIETDVTHVVIG